MKKNELKDVLKKMGISPNHYNLDGTGRTDERLCLEYTNNEWSVYYSERGVKTTNRTFSTEEEACQYIYEKLCWLLSH